MKKLLYLLPLFLLTACNIKYIQLYTVTAPNIQETPKAIIYEDDNCIITYNLWGIHGDFSFIFSNKTNQTLTLDMDQSFFIRNGFTHDYYSEDIHIIATALQAATTIAIEKEYQYQQMNYLPHYYPAATQLTTRASATLSKSLTSATAHKDKKQIAIPPHASRLVAGFILNQTIYHSDNLNPASHKEKQSHITFNQETTPLHFRNYLLYHGDSIPQVRTDHHFYISQITNTPYYDICERIYDGDRYKGDRIKPHIPAPNKFYNTYSAKKSSKRK